MNMDAHGLNSLVGTLLNTVIWNVFGMLIKMDVRGMKSRVGTLL
jgi:hypothetical protein